MAEIKFEDALKKLEKIVEDLEKGELFWFHLDPFSGLGVPAGVRFILFDDEAAKPSDFDASVFLQFVGKTLKNEVNNINCLFFRQV